VDVVLLEVTVRAPLAIEAEFSRNCCLRLRVLELIEEKGCEWVGGRNNFRKALEDVESAERLMRDCNATGPLCVLQFV
jgi:pre-mRNA-splicing factor 18